MRFETYCIFAMLQVFTLSACLGFNVDARAQEETTATVKADALRVRLAPSTDADILAKLPAGTKVQVVESPKQSSPWVRVRIRGGESTGWVHGDYLIFEDTGPDTNGLQFARVSIWTGDPRSKGIAAPGKPEQYRFYGVHGRFAAGTSFTVLAKDRPRSLAATAKQTLDVEFFPGTDLQPVTEIVFIGGDYRDTEPFMAVVGSGVYYEPIGLTGVTEPSKVTELTERVAREFPSFKTLPYDYKGSGFSSKETRAYAFSLRLAGTPAFLVSFKTPQTLYDNPDTIDGYCETAVVLWEGRPLNCSTDGAQGIHFFRIGDREFCWHNFDSCDNGIRYVDVSEFVSGKSVSVYTNNDFAS